MNIDDFRYIVTIADLGSFTKAAQKLFIAQPSLSQRVKHIEKTYGISIFLRDAKGVQLTKEGECFVRHAHKIINNEADLRREIADMHNPENKILKIGTTQFMQTFFFDKLLQEFHDEHPNMQFALYQGSSTEQQQNVLDGKCDLAICFLPIISRELKYETVYRDSYVLVPARGSELEKRIRDFRIVSPNEPIPLEFLNDEPLAVPTSGTRLYDYIKELEAGYDLHLNIQHYAKNYSMLYTIAKAGMASTILYESFFDPDKESLPFFYLDNEQADLQVAVVWRRDAYLQQSARELIRIAKNI